MTELLDILRQDFATARAAFNNSDPEDLNICANRLMANVAFGDESEKLYMMPGYFLRVIAVDLISIKDETVSQSSRLPAEQFISGINDAFQERLDIGAIWSAFFEYTESRYRLVQSPNERQNYRTNHAFTARGINYLTTRFFKDPFLETKDSVLLRAWLSESDRLIRNHGATQHELVLYSIMRALDWIDRYLALSIADAEKKGRSEDLKKEFISYLDRIKTWNSTSEDLPFCNATDILCDLLLCWRRFYFRYMDRTTQSTVEDKRVELSGKVKKRIGETIAHALQHDIDEKSRKHQHRKGRS